jgi:hypothetical protein
MEKEQIIKIGEKTEYRITVYNGLYIVQKNNWREKFFTTIEKLEECYPKLVGKVEIHPTAN